MNEKQTLKLYVRNFIFGAEDSLVSTVGLLSGIASTGMLKKEIVLSGLILILVEAFSMSVGSFLSEKSTEEADSKFIQNKSKTFGAAAIMFLSYFVCGFIPLAPYILLPGEDAFPLSIILSLAALFILGLVSAEILKTHRVKSAIRMFLIGGVAILIGVLVGKVVK